VVVAPTDANTAAATSTLPTNEKRRSTRDPYPSNYPEQPSK